jgi:hypothetical protein
MAQCAFCATETELHENGVPVCPNCSDMRTKPNSTASDQDIRGALLQEILEYTARTGEAAREFEGVAGQVPSGLPHPDGVQRIKNASINLSTARKELMNAHKRLDDYFDRGIVPEDLLLR